MRILAQTIHTTDGVANAAIAEAADRLEQFAGLKIRHADCDLDRVTVKLNPDGIHLDQTLGDLIDLRNTEKKETE
jgi:hypothetical protein